MVLSIQKQEMPLKPKEGHALGGKRHPGGCCPRTAGQTLDPDLVSRLPRGRLWWKLEGVGGLYSDPLQRWQICLHEDFSLDLNL